MCIYDVHIYVCGLRSVETRVRAYRIGYIKVQRTSSPNRRASLVQCQSHRFIDKMHIFHILLVVGFLAVAVRGAAIVPLDLLAEESKEIQEQQQLQPEQLEVEQSADGQLLVRSKRGLILGTLLLKKAALVGGGILGAKAVGAGLLGAGLLKAKAYGWGGGYSSGYWG